MTEKLRVGVIFGGRSGEHEVSLMSAASVIAALSKDKFEIVPFGISKTGAWLSGESAWRLLRGEAYKEDESIVIPVDRRHGVAVIDRAGGPVTWEPVDIMMPIVHGTYAEDGTLQGLLEMGGFPYVGAGVTASAVGMDKVMMKAVFRDAGLPIVPSAFYLRRQWQQQTEKVLDEIETRFGYPNFVKPANLGSSVGVSKAHDRSELRAALDLAARYDRKLVVEEAVNAREIECSVLGNDEPEASVAGEILPSREFYDYDSKYTDQTSRLLIPAPIDDGLMAEVRSLAVAAYKAVDCAGMARVDFFLDRDSGKLWLNELNTIPGFTSISMYPKMWEASGLPYPRLLERLIELGLERYSDMQLSETER